MKGRTPDKIAYEDGVAEMEYRIQELRKPKMSPGGSATGHEKERCMLG